MEKYVESQIVVFQSDGIEDIKAFHAKDTMWLTLDQMGVLFECEPSLIPKHIEDFLKEEKLDEELVCAKFAYMSVDGETFGVGHYNLDIIISVGYRIKFHRGIHFRRWAMDVMNAPLIERYKNTKQRLRDQDQMIELLDSTIGVIRDLQKAQGKSCHATS